MCYFSVSCNIWHLLLSRVFEANPKARIRCINLFDGSVDAPLWLILKNAEDNNLWFYIGKIHYFSHRMAVDPT